MKKTLAINQHKVRKTLYTNAVTHKWDNRSTTVIEDDDKTFVVEMKDATTANLSPRGMHKVLRGKVVVSSFRLSRVGAEALLLSLAEIMDFKLIDK